MVRSNILLKKVHALRGLGGVLRNVEKYNELWGNCYGVMVKFERFERSKLYKVQKIEYGRTLGKRFQKGIVEFKNVGVFAKWKILSWNTGTSYYIDSSMVFVSFHRW